MNKKTTLIIICAVVIACFLIFVFVMGKMIKENNKCVESPFTYAAKTIITDGSFLCSCGNSMNSFYFDTEGIYKNNPLISQEKITNNSKIFLIE